MTTVEEPPTLPADLVTHLPGLIEKVAAAGYASQRMVSRHLRVPWDMAADVLHLLVRCDVLGEPNDEDTYPVRTAPDEVREASARVEAHLAAPVEDVAGEVANEPARADLAVVDDPAPPATQPGDEPGVDLVKRDDATLAEWDGDEWDDAGEQPTARPVVSARDVGAWLRWHLVELAAVTTPSVAAVAVHPAWWLLSGVVGARWAALEWRARQHRAGDL